MSPPITAYIGCEIVEPSITSPVNKVRQVDVKFTFNSFSESIVGCPSYFDYYVVDAGDSSASTVSTPSGLN